VLVLIQGCLCIW